MGNEQVRQIDELVRRVEALPDTEARHLTVELLRAVLELHGAAIERLLELGGDELPEAAASDELCSAVLLLHGLHPESMEERVARAVEKLRLRLGVQGASVSLAAIEEGVVRLRYEGTSPRSAGGVREAAEEVLYSAAPEIAGIVIQGLREPASGFVPLTELVTGNAR